MVGLPLLQQRISINAVATGDHVITLPVINAITLSVNYYTIGDKRCYIIGCYYIIGNYYMIGCNNGAVRRRHLGLLTSAADLWPCR